MIFKRFNKIVDILLIMSIMVIISHGELDAKENPILNRFSIGCEIGNWQPHSLNDEPKFTDFGAAGATPFYGLFFVVPLSNELGFRTSLGFWSLRDLEEVEHVHSLTLHLFSVDMKYWLVPDYRLSAYVMYGGCVIWGVENDTSPFGDELKTARPGWGANLGAGFDLALSRILGFGMVFQYHYARFNKPLGGVDDFSGPKITGMLFIML